MVIGERSAPPLRQLYGAALVKFQSASEIARSRPPRISSASPFRPIERVRCAASSPESSDGQRLADVLAGGMTYAHIDLGNVVTVIRAFPSL